MVPVTTEDWFDQSVDEPDDDEGRDQRRLLEIFADDPYSVEQPGLRGHLLDVVECVTVHPNIMTHETHISTERQPRNGVHQQNVGWQ